MVLVVLATLLLDVCVWDCGEVSEHLFRFVYFICFIKV